MSPRNATQRNRSAEQLAQRALAIVVDRVAAGRPGFVKSLVLLWLSCFAFATRKHLYHAYTAGWSVEAPAIGSRHLRAAELPSY